jgi:5'-nucleotidase
MRRALAAIALLLGACAHVPRSDKVELRIIAFNDFHGYLETPAFGWLVPDRESEPGKMKRIAAGGVAPLASAIAHLKEGHAHTVVVAAGDLVGASPLASSLFLDEPTVNALSDAGLEISSVGNHEFDHGRDELMRLQRGGCAGEGSCADGKFRGARFHWLAANVIDAATGKPFMPAYEIREYDGMRVAFVGEVLRTTPQIVSASGIRGLEFRDEADTVNALVPEIRARGADAIVLLIHEGGRSQGPYEDQSCPGFSGPIVDIVKHLDPAIDAVVSGHTHEAYVCRVDGRLVTSAASYGRLVTAIDLTIDRGSRRVVASRAALEVVEPDRFTGPATLAAYVDHVAARAAVQGSRVVGTVEGEVTPLATADGNTGLGQLVADAQLAAMRDAAGVQVAFMNPGGLRAPLGGRGADHVVTYGDLHTVQPFGNTVVAMTLTGAQVVTLLEEQWPSVPGERVRLLQVSQGFRYAWDPSKPVGSRIVPGSVSIGGLPLDPAARYRIAVNSFLAGGTEGFTVLAEGTDRVGGPLDLAALEAFVRSRPLRAGTPERRIERINR